MFSWSSLPLSRNMRSPPEVATASTTCIASDERSRVHPLETAEVSYPSLLFFPLVMRISFPPLPFFFFSFT